MRRLFVLFAALMSLSACMVVVPVPVSLGTSGTAAQQPQPQPVQSPGRVDSFGAALNTERAKAGLHPVSLNTQLRAAAHAHAFDMMRLGYFDHASPNGARPSDRVAAQGYNWCHVAENIAKGQPTETAVLQAWMDSPGHRRNNLSRQAREYGLGHAGDVWVLVMASGC